MSDERRVRVLIVDDSSAQRRLLSRLLTRDPAIEIAGWASNGLEAVRAVARLRPDVVAMDDRMPMLSGLDAARRIMRDTPTPIVMISAAVGDDASRLAQEALAIGVLAVQGKRVRWSSEPRAATELVRLVKSMAEVRVVRRRRDSSPCGVLSALNESAAMSAVPEIVAIGASTGGPQALRQILERLPGNFPLPIVVVQHTTAGSSTTLVEWLSNASGLPVCVAEDGQPLNVPGVYIAPTDRHLEVRGRRLTLAQTAPVSLYRPSVTVLFRSVAAVYGPRSIGVLLTGMGDDGAVGLLDLETAGAVTVAQDESSSIVFGMPAEAIRLGAAQHILPPHRIADVLLEHVASKDAA